MSRLQLERTITEINEIIEENQKDDNINRVNEMRDQLNANQPDAGLRTFFRSNNDQGDDHQSEAIAFESISQSKESEQEDEEEEAPEI